MATDLDRCPRSLGLREPDRGAPVRIQNLEGHVCEVAMLDRAACVCCERGDCNDCGVGVSVAEEPSACHDLRAVGPVFSHARGLELRCNLER